MSSCYSHISCYFSLLIDIAELTKNAVYVLKIRGQDSLCGIVGICPGETAKCDITKSFVPDALQGKITIEEFKDMADKVASYSSSII